MKRTSILTIVGVLMVALALVLCSGCGKEQGAEFIGTWKSPTATMSYSSLTTIQKGNGDSFIITNYIIDKKNPDDSKKGSTYSAVYDNGRLKVTDGDIIYLDGDIIKNSSGIIGTRVKYSDKALTFDELNNEKLLKL